MSDTQLAVSIAALWVVALGLLVLLSGAGE